MIVILFIETILKVRITIVVELETKIRIYQNITKHNY